MKRYEKMLSVLFMCILLAGCAARPGSGQTETLTPVVPETTVPMAEIRQQADGAEVTQTAEATEPTETGAVTEVTEATETTDAVVFQPTIIPVITKSQNSVTVTSADEFLAAIAPDTEIIVSAELIDFSTAAGYGTSAGEYYRWNESFDGPELYISGVSNLTVRGNGADRKATVLSAVPRYANVLNFENCSNILVKDLTAGHTQEPGYCMGGVLFFLNCEDILIENCGLFGCGTLGVNAYSSKNMQIVNNEIYECSVGGVEFTNCDGINVDGNTFRDLGGPVFRIYNCGSITCNGEEAVPFR